MNNGAGVLDVGLTGETPLITLDLDKGNVENHRDGSVWAVALPSGSSPVTRGRPTSGAARTLLVETCPPELVALHGATVG